MVSFEKFVKSMPPILSELKVTPSFPFKIPDDLTATSKEIQMRTIEGFSPVVGMHYAIGLHLARIFLRLQVSDVSESESERFFRLSKIKWLICGGWMGCCATPTNFLTFDSFS